MKYTNEQYIQIIDSLIESQTEYQISDFTGGSVGVTLVNNSTQLKYKFTMYFGFKNKNAISKVIEVEQDTYNVLIKALEVKALSSINTTNTLSLDSINTLLTTSSTTSSNTMCTTPTITNTINTNTNESKILDEDFESVWKGYTLGFLKKQGRSGGSKTKAKEKYLNLRNKYSKDDIHQMVKNHMKLKIGNKDLERVLTLEMMIQHLEDIKTISKMETVNSKPLKILNGDAS